MKKVLTVTMDGIRYHASRPADCRHCFFWKNRTKGDFTMEFFNSAVDVLKTLVVALGAGLGVWGAINLLEGYGNDNPGSNAHVS